MTHPSTRVERSRKPIKCPGCGNRPVAKILFGMPDFNEQLKVQLEQGLVVLGGCEIGPGNPSWECSQCGLQIFRRSSR